MSGVDEPIEPCLSVVIPCFNEEATLKTVVDKVLDSPFTQEVVIVDDGSTDGTLTAARSVTDPRVRVFSQPRNLGKGAALRRGFAEAHAPCGLDQDAGIGRAAGS